MPWKDSFNVPVSSRGEWSAKRCYGDPKLAAAYLPVAYALLGAVKNRMAYGGVGFGHQQIELPDGTRIRVLRNGNQNILEIDARATTAFPLVMGKPSWGYVFYPWGGGGTRLRYGWVLPITENEPLGTPAVATWVPDDKDSGYLSAVATQYLEPGKITLTPALRTALLVGNQFSFFGVQVFSWWGSPCGDGPLAYYTSPLDIPDLVFRPVRLLTLLVYRTLDHQLQVCPRTLYRNGFTFLTAPGEILGFQAIRFSLDNGENFIERGVLLYLDAITGGVRMVLVDLGVIDPPDLAARSRVIYANGQNGAKVASNSLMWPWRMTSDGSEISAIVREPDCIAVVTLTILQEEDRMSLAGTNIDRHYRNGSYSSVVTQKGFSRGVRSGGLGFQRENDGVGGGTRIQRFGTEVLGGNPYNDYLTTTKSELSNTYSVPFALNYQPNNTLDVRFIEFQNTETIDRRWDFSASIDQLGISTMTWTRLGGAPGGGYEYHVVANVDYSGFHEQLSVDVQTESAQFGFSLMGMDFPSIRTRSYNSTESTRRDEQYSISVDGNYYDFSTYPVPPTKNSESFFEKNTDFNTVETYTYDHFTYNIAYINVCAESLAVWKSGYTETRTSSRTRAGGVSVANSPISPSGFIIDYGSATIYYIDVPTTFLDNYGTEDSGEYTNSTTTQGHYDLQVYGVNEQTYRFDRNTFDEGSEPQYGAPHVRSWGGAIDTVVTNQREVVDLDRTNGLVDIRDTVMVSVATDYARPLLFSASPTYMAASYIWYGGDDPYMKRSASFGDPNQLFNYPAGTLFLPIGLY